MEDRGLYKETSRWSWWVTLLFGITFLPAVIALQQLASGNVGGGDGAMPGWTVVLLLSLGFGLPGAIYAFMGELRVQVKERVLDLRWGYLEVIRKEISFQDVARAEAVTYSPIRDFGGWGIRYGTKGKRGWTVKGNQALVLHLVDGTRFYVGSDRPERLLQWVESARKRSGE